MAPVELADIRIEYRRQRRTVFALHGFDLELQEGDLVHLRGRSGSGKTSLLRLLAGLQAPARGTVRLWDVDLYRCSASCRSLVRNRLLGFLTQDTHLLPMFDVLMNVMIPRLIAGEPRRKARTDAFVLLERFGVAHRAYHRPHEISGGEQRRVGLARALINDPALILADEPFTELDADNRAVIQDTMLELLSDGRMVVVASHIDLPQGLVARVVDLESYTDPIGRRCP